MGGHTITKVAVNIGELLIYVKEQIELGAKAGLCPDGDVFVLNPSTEVSFILRPIFIGADPSEVAFKPVVSGDVKMAIAVSKKYGPTPARGEWVAGVHLH
ncbi:hypothetical protein MUO93_06815 [Candidatus Bathyarchaeota archaeon]|nr:hypothetical protein [Candidatus Bathyarchaeota archaeon]